MPIHNCDATALEINAVAFLSQDSVLLNEIISGADIHTNNQNAFNLPSRLIAKIFVFRLVYGGSAYSYANDPDFKDVSTSVEFWQEVIDAFYFKYKGIAKWHEQIVSFVTQHGYYIAPTGRRYDYTLNQYNKWPETKIKNYPVQGLGADLMMIARIIFAKWWYSTGYEGKLISTVHDSIVLDAPSKHTKEIVSKFHEVFRDIPKTFTKIFGIEYNLPMFCEVKVGSNMRDLEVYKL